MDQLSEPIEINRKFIKLVDIYIKPHYDNILHDILHQLQKEINEKYIQSKVD